MNCRDAEHLILSERDGALSADQLARIETHAAACPACRQQRMRLTEALNAFQTDAAQVTLPDVAAEWRTLRAQLAGRQGKPARKRPLAPVIWFGAPLAAVAAMALVYLGLQPKVAEPAPAAADIAQAEFVEPGDANASTMVYVDKESGWLVVWAADSSAVKSG